MDRVAQVASTVKMTDKNPRKVIVADSNGGDRGGNKLHVNK